MRRHEFVTMSNDAWETANAVDKLRSPDLSYPDVPILEHIGEGVKADPDDAFIEQQYGIGDDVSLADGPVRVYALVSGELAISVPASGEDEAIAAVVSCDSPEWVGVDIGNGADLSGLVVGFTASEKLANVYAAYVESRDASDKFETGWVFSEEDSNDFLRRLQRNRKLRACTLKQYASPSEVGYKGWYETASGDTFAYEHLDGNITYHEDLNLGDPSSVPASEAATSSDESDDSTVAEINDAEVSSKSEDSESASVVAPASDGNPTASGSGDEGGETETDQSGANRTGHFDRATRAANSARG